MQNTIEPGELVTEETRELAKRMQEAGCEFQVFDDDDPDEGWDTMYAMFNGGDIGLSYRRSPDCPVEWPPAETPPTPAEPEFGQDICGNCGWDEGKGLDRNQVDKWSSTGDALCPWCGDSCGYYDYRDDEPAVPQPPSEAAMTWALELARNDITCNDYAQAFLDYIEAAQKRIAELEGWKDSALKAHGKYIEARETVFQYGPWDKQYNPDVYCGDLVALGEDKNQGILELARVYKAGQKRIEKLEKQLAESREQQPDPTDGCDEGLRECNHAISVPDCEGRLFTYQASKIDCPHCLRQEIDKLKRIYKGKNVYAFNGQDEAWAYTDHDRDVWIVRTDSARFTFCSRFKAIAKARQLAGLEPEPPPMPEAFRKWIETNLGAVDPDAAWKSRRMEANGMMPSWGDCWRAAQEVSNDE